MLARRRRFAVTAGPGDSRTGHVAGLEQISPKKEDDSCLTGGDAVGAGEHIGKSGGYGQVADARFDGGSLPGVDNWVRMVVAEGPGDVDEWPHYLQDAGGRLYLTTPDESVESHTQR